MYVIKLKNLGLVCSKAETETIAPHNSVDQTRFSPSPSRARAEPSPSRARNKYARPTGNLNDCSDCEFDQGRLTEGDSTVDLLIKIARFVNRVNNIFHTYGADLN